MIRPLSALLLPFLDGVAIPAAAQQGAGTPESAGQRCQPEEPAANPGRPTVSTPATLTPVVWHFTQPFLRSNAVGNLRALSYTARKNFVLDGGFNRGLTSTSTRWGVFLGFAYLLPYKLWASSRAHSR
jgi:hypothetical protein